MKHRYWIKFQFIYDRSMWMCLRIHSIYFEFSKVLLYLIRVIIFKTNFSSIFIFTGSLPSTIFAGIPAQLLTSSTTVIHFIFHRRIFILAHCLLSPTIPDELPYSVLHYLCDFHLHYCSLAELLEQIEARQLTFTLLASIIRYDDKKRKTKR